MSSQSRPSPSPLRGVLVHARQLSQVSDRLPQVSAVPTMDLEEARSAVACVKQRPRREEERVKAKQRARRKLAELEDKMDAELAEIKRIKQTLLLMATRVSSLYRIMSYQRVPLKDWEQEFLSTTELSSVALGGRIVSVSDEFFAEAFHLLQVEPAPSLKGQFGPKGALYSGWESRRHNPTYDWCIIKLGTTGTILGFDIDTTHFNGNEAPQVSVSALHASSSEEPQADDVRWSTILPTVDLGPNSRHLFKILESSRANYVKLNMYPDGGIARFRVYGLVTPVWPEDVLVPFDLAHVFAGARVETTSDQHFGVGSNLILPGRGKDMGDGWETKRSRQPGHDDWAVIKLGAPGFLEAAEIDTANFMGNFPESCELHATATALDQQWTQILPRTKLGPHRRHFFHLENVQGRAYTHVKLTIYPDGGVKRVRIIGRRADGSTHLEAKTPDVPVSGAIRLVPAIPHSVQVIPALPLCPEAFAPFGQVIQAYADPNAAPRGTRITPANGGTASKFHKLGLFESSYPSEAGATPGLSVYRCKPVADLEGDGSSVVRVLERHPFTKQAFIPMGGGRIEGGDGLTDAGAAYLVVVAKDDPEGKPDLKTLRAFVATGAQGIMYDTAVWHQPMTVLGKSMDFTCVESQIGNGDKADCEIVELDGKDSVYKVRVPGYVK